MSSEKEYIFNKFLESVNINSLSKEAIIFRNILFNNYDNIIDFQNDLDYFERVVYDNLNINAINYAYILNNKLINVLNNTYNIVSIENDDNLEHLKVLRALYNRLIILYLNNSDKINYETIINVFYKVKDDKENCYINESLSTNLLKLIC